MFSKKAVFINTASQIIVRVVTLAFALISIKLLANYLGPSGIGNYNTIVTYVNFFIVIADLGLFAATVREVSKNPDQEKKIVSNVFLLRLISALVATVIAILIAFATSYPSEIKMGVLIATGYLFFNLLASVYDMVLQYRLKMQYSALAEFLSKLITLSALYLLIVNHFGFVWIVGTVSLSGILIFLFKWIFAKKFLSVSPAYDKKIFNWIFSISWPLGLVFIVNNLYFKLDTLMLFSIKGAEAVGIYSVAYKVLEVTVFVAGYFAASLKPTISRYIQNSKDRLGEIISKSIMVLIVLVIPITAISVAYSREIIIFLSNEDFASGSKALILLAFALPLIFIDTLLGEILIANDARKLLIRASIFILLFNFLTNLIFIPLYSFMGAAFTTILSELVLLGINIYYTKKIISYKLDFGALFKSALLFVLTLIFAFMIKRLEINFLFLIAISVLFFVLMSQFLGVAKFSALKKMLASE